MAVLEPDAKSSAAVCQNIQNSPPMAEVPDRASPDDGAVVSDCSADISREIKKKGEAKYAFHDCLDRQARLVFSSVSFA